MTEKQIYFTTKEAADLLPWTCATLAIWRSAGQGPTYEKIGRSIVYHRDDLEEWMTGGDANRRNIESLAECHKAKRETAKRPRGRAGAGQRARRLAAEPLCRDCLEHGVERFSEEVDHIIPLAQGGSDEDDNIRCLCKPCHREQTKMQSLASAAGG